MITINADTKIAAVIKAHPGALEAIISLSPKFNKLRNPVLRKLMASRTSLFTASKVGGCSVNDFFLKLEPLGFTIDRTTAPSEDHFTAEKPGFMNNIQQLSVETLDVRPVIAEGKDPFSSIMQKINELPADSVLLLINTFAPVPLLNILSKQGFEYFVEHKNDDLVHTYFFRKGGTGNATLPQVGDATGWDEVYQRFRDKLVNIDVRHLEMPQPMHMILEALEQLPKDQALFVQHKRIPVFLLPELEERKMEYRIKEISDGNVHLLIFHSEC
ncbi:MAG: DUF2249 domain-containing protein [Bacteroidia bacterium]|nr:DUF2249 domain-containing protein [Bacteroidia bacterium]